MGGRGCLFSFLSHFLKNFANEWILPLQIVIIHRAEYLQIFKMSDVSEVVTVLMETTLMPGKYRVGWLCLQIDKKSWGQRAAQDYSQTAIISCFLFKVNLTRDFRSLNRIHSVVSAGMCTSVCMSFPASLPDPSGKSWSSQSIVFPLLFSPCSSLWSPSLT